MDNLIVKQDNMNMVYYKTLIRLLTIGTTITNRQGETLTELINPTLILTNPIDCFCTVRKMSFDYLKGEMEFYMSGSDRLKDIARYSKFWNKCSDDGETIISNYGKLLLHDKNSYGYTQFNYAKEMLIRNKDSKKAVMTIYAPNHAKKSNDNPCTMYLQFFIRKERLDLYVKMRSSDVWYGLPYDIPFFVFIQTLLKEELNQSGYELDLGVYNHQAGSLHFYHRNLEKILETIKFFRQNYRELSDEEQGYLYEEHILSKLWRGE